MLQTLIARDGEAQSSREGLEHGFDLMMGRTAVEGAQVNVGAGGLRESLKEILGELGLKIADKFRGDLSVADAVGTSAEVDRGGCESFVHGHQEIARAKDAAFVAQSLHDGFAQSDAGVFHGVVLVDVEISFCLDCEIE